MVLPAVARPHFAARFRRSWRTLRRFRGRLRARARLHVCSRWIAARANLSERAPATARTRALGAVIAVRGEQARAVFAAAGHLPCPPDIPPDVVLADSAAEAANAIAPTVVLKQFLPLMVPAFDPARCNPIGWLRHAGNRVAALGPLRLLPAGVTAHRALAPTARRALRFIHHVEDVQAFHADPVERAGVLVRLAAMGVPVCLADGGPGLEPLLGSELHALMNADMRNADAGARERLSVGMRRAALRDHSLRSRARQVCTAAPGTTPPELPCVTVLLATRRPQFLQRALANVAAQDYPRLELVLALHGDGFARAAVRRAVASLSCPVNTIRRDGDRPLGDVLNAAATVGVGDLLTKMDDDDLYAAHHIWDLVLARQYSGAQLVAKAVETVYLTRTNTTVQQFLGGAETYRWPHLAGGAMMIARGDLERVGGWRPVRCGEDLALIADVRRTGGAVYRTHGVGYVLVRHTGEHTWDVEEADFSAGADAVHRGWHPALAGFEDGPAPPGVAGDVSPPDPLP